MSQPRRSFFRTIPGFLTGLAGVVSAGVGAVGLAVQQGWIGDGDKPSTSTTVVGGQGGSGSRTGREGSFSVSPTSVSFQPVGSREAAVTVRNTGDVALDLEEPEVTGSDAAQFEADSGTCTGTLGPGRSCQLEVTFRPKTGRSEALLVVSARGAPKATEVSLQGAALL